MSSSRVVNILKEINHTNMLKKIHRHFQKVDSLLASKMKNLTLIKKVSPKKYFVKLCGEIINQQLSDKSSATIFERFKKLFPDGAITPHHVLALSHERIRKTGPSNAKVKYIKDLAQKVVNQEIDFERLEKLDDESAIQELTKIKGVGRWTAEMFLMFSLGRQDIFSYGDLGLKKAIKKIYGFKKEPTQKEMETIVQKWSPYRTYASVTLWGVIDN